jgi:hypothetical protein
MISAEYTGPLEFMQFWLDVIGEWENETGEDVIIGLSATRDVQDAILEDELRAGTVDVIDIRYWAYRSDGSLYAPEGGMHMSPRQHARQVKPGSRSFEQVYRAVSEYRRAFPEKAVICSEPGSAQFGWAVLLAGGSLPNLPAGMPAEIYEDLADMHPSASAAGVFSMSGPEGARVFYLKSGDRLDPDQEAGKGLFQAYMIDPYHGEITRHISNIDSAQFTEFVNREKEDRILWITRHYMRIPLK